MIMRYLLTGSYQSTDKSNPLRNIDGWLIYNAGKVLAKRDYKKAPMVAYEQYNADVQAERAAFQRVECNAGNFSGLKLYDVVRIQWFYSQTWQLVLVHQRNMFNKSRTIHVAVRIEDQSVAAMCKLKFFCE